MILQLLLSFLKIGVTTFGGGMGMIPIIYGEVVTANGWITDEMFYNMVAIAESTPGPIAINMATYIGNTLGGVFGSIIATFAVVLPSFIIILLIASLLKNFMNNKYVLGAVNGVTPVVVSLLIITGLFLAVGIVLPNFESGITSFCYKELILICAIFLWYVVHKIVTKKYLNPILMIVVSAIIGAIFL